jgi:hypothetical protein
MATHKKLSIIFTLILISLVGSACSDSPFEAGSSNNQVALLANDQFIPDNMIGFEGHVFVASTRPSKTRWQIAGWQIAVQPIVRDEESIPIDCTLYPHQGVDDQWIGSCAGYTYIPRDGANHIAVMHTQPDGTKRLIQVAPPPVVNEP